jgi:hypothetical protein
MSDYEFEARLERLFNQPPPVSDPNLFAAQVQARLERGGSLRGVLITTAGVAGGVVAASQTFGSGLLAQLGDLRLPVRPLLDRAAEPGLFSSEGLTALAGGGEVVWMAAAMLALTVGFIATRFSDAF